MNRTAMMQALNDRQAQKTRKLRLSKTSFMNNTKWCKLLEEIEVSDLSLNEAKIKVLARQQTYPFSLKIGVDETRTYTGDGICGPVSLLEIEWIFIPTRYEIAEYNGGVKYRSSFVTNDVPGLKNLIDGLGKFEYDWDENGLKIYGYK